MDNKYGNYINYVYVIICVSVTIGLGINCLVNYLKDEDVSLTEYKKFHHDDPDNDLLNANYEGQKVEERNGG